MPGVSTLAETRIGVNGTPLATWQPGERKQLDLASFRTLTKTAQIAAYLAWAWPRAVPVRTLAQVIRSPRHSLGNLIAPLIRAGSVCRVPESPYHLPTYRLVRPEEDAR